MRADRLLALMMLLKTRGRMTAGRLAAELEVSERTIYRDLYALRVAGLPVYTERGPGGGCYLHEDFRTGLTSLSGDELSALFVSSIPAPLRDLGLSSPLRGAMLKIAGALPEARRADGIRLAERVHIDTVPWVLPAEPVPHLAALHQALLEDRLVRVVFRRITGILSERIISPVGLVAKVSTWYLVWLGEDGRVRVDPVSRVVEAEATDRRFERPDEFDLAACWEGWCARQEASRTSFEADLLVASEVRDLLQERHGERFQEIAPPEGCSVPRDWSCARISFAHIYEARERILGLGAAVEVLAPRELRFTVADFAAGAAARYAERSPR
ncbi:MAG: WYL domain-containing protein [Candidatus Bipolaricaulota bacterium]|nr:MAG: WYL domain-containing protein [Candidatus Bipolaricaulota bacterium]